MGGAISRVNAGGTAFAHRHATWVCEILGHLHADELDAYRGYDASHYARLVTLKTTYGPDNVFRLNPNIRPQIPARSSR